MSRESFGKETWWILEYLLLHETMLCSDKVSERTSHHARTAWLTVQREKISFDKSYDWLRVELFEFFFS